MEGSGTFDCYVGNLPLHCNEKEVREIFAVAGEIVGVKILPPAQSTSDGKVAFLKFTEESDAHCCALYMNNHMLDDGTTLKVKYRSGSGVEETIAGQTGFPGAKLHTDYKKGDDSLEQIFVSHVESPIAFWGQASSEIFATQLQELTDKMEALCPHRPGVFGPISTEIIYGCKFSEDNLWYRCSIEKVLTKNTVHVRYIDYGNEEATDKSNLVTLPNDLATFPAMSKCYHIEGIELAVKDETSQVYEKCLDELIELINEERVGIRSGRKENEITMARICQDANGVSIDVPGKLVSTGCVRIKGAIGNFSSFATAVKLADKTMPNNLSIPKTSPSFADMLIPDSSITKPSPSFADILTPDSPNRKASPSFADILTPDSPNPKSSPSFANILSNGNDSPASSPPGYKKNNENDSSSKSPISDSPPPGFKRNIQLDGPPANHIRNNDSPSDLANGLSNGHTTDTHLKTNNSIDKLSERFDDESFNMMKSGVTNETRKEIVSEKEVGDQNISKEEERAENTIDDGKWEVVPEGQRWLPTSATNGIQSKDNIVKKNSTSSLGIHTKENVFSSKITSAFEHENVEANVVDNSFPSSNVARKDIVQFNTKETEEVSAVAKCKMVQSNAMDDSDEVEIPKVRYEDIGGYKMEIEKVKASVNLSINHRDLFKKVGIKSPRGVLLCGPHGTGKTLIARAIANESKVSIQEIFAPSLGNGSTDDCRRHLDKLLKQLKRNTSAILILDEIDALPSSNDRNESKCVTMLLKFLQKLGENVVVISTAISSDDIDPSLIRAGLFESKILIPLPDESTRLDILRVLSKKISLSKAVSLEKIAEETEGYNGSDIAALCKLAVMNGINTKISALQASSKLKQEPIRQISVNMSDFRYAIDTTRLSVEHNTIDIPTVSWNSICGMTDLRNELKDLIEQPASYEDVKMLLCGPYGSDKKMVAQAISNECKCKFISVKGYLLCESNDQENNICSIFARARTSAPCIIYIEEIELLTPANNLLNDLLKEIDSISRNDCVYVIGGSSRPSAVHPSLLGRLSKVVHVPLPDQKTRKFILEKGIGKRRSAEINSDYLDKLAKRLECFTMIEIKCFLRKVGKLSFKGDVTSSHFEKVLRNINCSVTESDVDECRKFIEKRSLHKSPKTKRKDEGDSSKDVPNENLAAPKMDGKVTFTGLPGFCISYTNCIAMMLGLFTIACFIYILGLSIYTSMK